MSGTIAFVINGDETYGISRFTASIVEQWTKSGVRCEVFSLSDGPLAQICAEKGANVYRAKIVPPPYYGRSGLEALQAAVRLTARSILALRHLGDWFHQIRPDFIIVRAPNIVPMTALAAKMIGTPSFWILPNEVSDRYPLNINKRLYDLFLFATGMTPIANSAFTKSTLLNQLVKAKFVHLGIDSTVFDPTRVIPISRAKYGLSHLDPVAGVFARVTPEKGQLELIHAIALLNSELSNFHLLVCGGPMESDYGRHLINSADILGLGQRIHFLGAQADVRGLNLMCDFIINSRLTPEPFGLSVIEGMMLGRPVLAHKAGGPGETIIDGKTGWLVENSTSDELAAGLRRALVDRPKWGKMGASARVHALSEFDISITAERLLKLFSEADKIDKRSARNQSF